MDCFFFLNWLKKIIDEEVTNKTYWVHASFLNHQGSCSYMYCKESFSGISQVLGLSLRSSPYCVLKALIITRYNW